MTKREVLIAKFERNSLLVSKFKYLYKAYLDKTNRWNVTAFPDSKITNKQYYDEFTRISGQEYSSKQYEAIKNVVIQDQFLDEYISGIDNQFKQLSVLFDNLKENFKASNLPENNNTFQELGPIE